MVTAIVIVGFFVLVIWGAIANEKNPAPPKKPAPKPQLRKGPHGIYCPLCKGTQFKARRTAGQRAMIGTAGALTGGLGAAASARKRQQKVQCVTCGTFYDRIPV